MLIFLMFRSCAMIDFLLDSEAESAKAEPCQEEMRRMVYCRDINGKNVLSTYFSNDLGKNFHT